MNTPNKAYATKISSGTILALLLFSGLVFLIPVANPIFAANTSLPTISVTGNNPALGGDTLTFTLTVSNPSSNQYTLTGVTINAASGWSVSSCTDGGFLVTCTHSASAVTWSVSQFLVGTAAGIPPGSSDSFTFTATAATGTYPFTSSFTSKVQDASSVTFYNGPSFSILVIDPTTTISAVTPAASANYVAGSAALTESATITPAQAGVPIVFSAPGYGVTTTYGFTPATSTTNSAGVATTSFQPSNHAGDHTTVMAAVGTSAVAPAASVGTITTVAGAPTEVTWTLASSATSGVHYITTEGTTVNQGGSTTAVSGAKMAAAGASYSIADKFGNPVAFNTVGLTWTVTLTALSGAGVFDALGLPAVITCSVGGDWMSGGSPITPPTACPAAGTSANLPFTYFQSAAYDTIGELSAGVSGSLSGSAFAGAGQSGQLITSTFAAASPVPLIIPPTTVPPTPLGAVPAGDKVNVTATLVPPNTCGAAGNAACPAQSGVPVSLMLDQVNSYDTVPAAEDYGANSVLTVGFSDGLTYTSAPTNANGLASGLFTISTLAGAHAYFLDNVTAPTDALPTASLANSTTPAAGTQTITTAGLPTTFTVITYYDSTLLSPTTHAATGATLYVDVVISDAYGNVAANNGQTAIQITLTPSAGVLSATNVYIPQFGSDTASTFGAISWTVPSTTGSVTLTASGVLAGVQKTSAPDTVAVVSPLPTIAIISPTPQSGVIYSSTDSVVFTGQANVSLGYASAGAQAVHISSVTYSVDGGAVQTAPTTPGYSITFAVAATFTPGLHTITFNATDSLGNVASSTSYSVLVDPTTPTVAFTTRTGSTINYTNSVTATITVAEGDLNSSSVVATVNGTALASTDVTISGTNNLGHSVTYTVTLSGLAAGTDTIGLSATSLTGLTGSATAITVTVQVAFSSSVVITSATYGTLANFNGVTVTATNVWSTSQNLVVFAVWKNSAGQTVAVTTGGLTLASGASGSAFAPLPGSLPSGSYTVNVFVVTTSNAPVSSTTSISASA
jgi:hypothetical protein